MRFGIREICEVVFRARTTQYLGKRKFYKNEPVLYFDTLKTSSLEGAATTVYATGGRGNTQLVAWEGERTLTFTMEDALISPESFSILSGAGLLDASEDEPIYVHQTKQIEVKEANTIVLPEEACWNKYDSNDPLYHRNADIFVMTMTNGEIDSEPCIPYAVDEDKKTLTCYSHAGQIDVGDIVFVDWYVKRTGSAKLIEITPDQFGGYYYIEAATLFRDENSGADLPAEFIIPKAKVQSNFTFSMAATGDPSTFTFTLDAFPDYVKFKETKKVLAALQVITDAYDESEDRRVACKPQSVVSLTTGVNVSFDNDSTEDYCKLTATGNNVDGRHYDPTMWGTALKNAAELEIVMPIEENGKYRLRTQNPVNSFYPDDPSIKQEGSAWIKDKEYEITDGSLTLRTALTDVKGAIIIELYKSGDVDPIKVFTIDNQVNFLKFYTVNVENTSGGTVKYEKKENNQWVSYTDLNGEQVTPNTELRLTVTTTGDDAPIVSANGTIGKIKESKVNGDYVYTMIVGNIGGDVFNITIA